MMKKSDLHREWARVLDMCELTKVKPESCWKYAGFKTDQHIPEFIEDYDKYEFALAILEDKPVFVGDVLYWSNDGNVFDWKHGTLSKPEYYPLNLTWNPPKKKTFMLNGVELPRPDTEDGYMFSLQGSNQRKNYYFKSMQDRDKLVDTVIDIIEDALK